MENFIRKRDDQMLRACFKYGATIRRFLYRTQEIATRDDAGELAFVVDNQRSLAMR